MTYDPEKGAARDLPRDRYLRAAYKLLRLQGADLLILIAERGEDEFARVAGAIFGANGFVVTREEWRSMFKGLEKAAYKAHQGERRRELYIEKYGRSERPHGRSPFDDLVDAAGMVNS
jgi:hypothetical protein